MIKAVIFDMYETLITHYECPLYFSAEMAEDAGIPAEKFQELWRTTATDRTIGKLSFEEIIQRILQENNTYSEERFQTIVDKRIWTKEETFRHLHEEIIPVLEKLKEKGILIGLISNCFSEEAEVIKKSILYPYFNASCLSYEEGLQKPDSAIFQRCMERLQVEAEECLYVGDGGSGELEAAQKLGMKAVQAVWYLKAHPTQMSKRKEDFEQIESPVNLLVLV